MATYESYKDSGVKWLGQIPSQWEVKKLRHVLSERKERYNPSENLIILSLLKNIGVIPYDEKGEIGNKSKTDFSSYKIARKGDLVINSMNIIIGSVGISNYDGYISPAYYAYIPRDNCSLKYLNYLFSLSIVQKSIRCYSKGIMEIRLRISSNDFLSMPFPYPSLQEQEAIVAYLDKVTGVIDRAIESQQRMIDALNERKQIIITRAVTRGLNPDAPLRDSGINWLGQIPEHWNVMKLGALGITSNGISNDASYFGEGYPFVSYGDVYKNFSLPNEIRGLAKSSVRDQIIFSVKRGDVFFTRTSETVDEIGLSSVCLKTIPQAVFAGSLICWNLIR